MSLWYVRTMRAAYQFAAVQAKRQNPLLPTEGATAAWMKDCCTEHLHRLCSRHSDLPLNGQPENAGPVSPKVMQSPFHTSTSHSNCGGFNNQKHVLASTDTDSDELPRKFRRWAWGLGPSPDMRDLL